MLHEVKKTDNYYIHYSSTDLSRSFDFQVKMKQMLAKLVLLEMAL